MVCRKNLQRPYSMADETPTAGRAAVNTPAGPSQGSDCTMHEPNFLERVKQIVRVLREAGPEEGRTDPAETFRFLAKLAEVRVAEATGFEVTGEPVEQAPGEGYVRHPGTAGTGRRRARGGHVPIKDGKIGEVE